MLISLLGGMFAKVAVAILNFSILLLSSRYLGPASRGEIGLYLLNIALVQLVCEIYTGYALVRLAPRYNNRLMVRNGFFFILIVCPAIYLVLLLFGLQVKGYEAEGLFTCLLVVVNTFNCVMLMAAGRLRLYNLVSMLQPALLLCFLAVSIFLMDTYTFQAYSRPLLLSFLAAVVVSGVLVVLSVRKNEGVFSWKELLKDGLIYQLSIIALILVNRLSFYLLQNKTEVGIYAVATSLMEASLVFTTGIVPTLLTKVSASPAAPLNAKLAVTLARLSVILSLVLILLLLIIPDSLFVMALGNGFAPLRKIMLMYAPGALMLGYFSTLAAWMAGAGHQRQVCFAYCCGLLCSVMLAPWFVKHHHMAGAALVADISYMIITFLIIYFCLRNSSLPLRLFFSPRLEFKMIGKSGPF